MYGALLWGEFVLIMLQRWRIRIRYVTYMPKLNTIETGATTLLHEFTSKSCAVKTLMSSGYALPPMYKYLGYECLREKVRLWRIYNCHIGTEHGLEWTMTIVNPSSPDFFAKLLRSTTFWPLVFNLVTTTIDMTTWFYVEFIL